MIDVLDFKREPIPAKTPYSASGMRSLGESLKIASLFYHFCNCLSIVKSDIKRKAGNLLVDFFNGYDFWEVLRDLSFCTKFS